MLLFHSATCQKIIPWGKHTQCDAHRGLTSMFLFWEGKRVTPCFSISERLFLGWQEKGKLLKSLIQNQETFITEIAGWGTWPQILPHIQNTPVMPQMLHLCTSYLLRVLSQVTFPWHISISPMFYKPASSSSSAQWLFFHSWVQSLINQPISPAQTWQPPLTIQVHCCSVSRFCTETSRLNRQILDHPS